MLDFKTALRILEMSIRHIAEGRQRIRGQIALIRELGTDGHDVTIARKVLGSLQAWVSAERRHRALIVEVINNLR